MHWSLTQARCAGLAGMAPREHAPLPGAPAGSLRLGQIGRLCSCRCGNHAPQLGHSRPAIRAGAQAPAAIALAMACEVTPKQAQTVGLISALLAAHLPERRARRRLASRLSRRQESRRPSHEGAPFLLQKNTASSLPPAISAARKTPCPASL